MKKVIFILIAVVALSAPAGISQAAPNGRSSSMIVQRSGNGGIIAKLIELERRKNAALRRMFSN